MILKAIFYTVDLASDIGNGALMAKRVPTSNTSIITYTFTVPGYLDLSENPFFWNYRTRSYEVTKVECEDDEMFHLWWGYLSIAFTWLPGLVALVFLIKMIQKPSYTYCDLLLLPAQLILRVIFWPLLVPILM